jgi:hypothetical protein
MITFLLYLATAICTGWQLSQQILMGVWGKPSNPLEYLAFVGSLILLVSAYVALFSLRRARRIAIGASALLWIFYVPACINTIVGTSSGGFTMEILVFVPIVLLVSTTAYSILMQFGLLRQRTSNAILPDAPPRNFRRSVLVLSGLAVLSVGVINFFFVGVEREVSTPVDCTIEHEAGHSIAKLTFQNFHGFSCIETDSEEVLAYLEKNNPQNVIVRVSLTYDLGKVRALNLNYAYLGDIRFRPYVERKP